MWSDKNKYLLVLWWLSQYLRYGERHCKFSDFERLVHMKPTNKLINEYLNQLCIILF